MNKVISVKPSHLDFANLMLAIMSSIMKFFSNKSYTKKQKYALTTEALQYIRSNLICEMVRESDPDLTDEQKQQKYKHASESTKLKEVINRVGSNISPTNGEQP